MGLTLFELHTHGDIQFGSGSMLPSIDSDEEEREDEPVVPTGEDEDDGSRVPRAGVAALIALVALVGLVGVAKYLMGELDEEPIELVESDEL